MNIKTVTFSRFQNLAIVFALVTSLLSFAPTSASAVADGTINCGTSGTFTIASNVVTTVFSCVGSVVIPEGVLSVEQYAFSKANLTSLSIANTVTSIGAFAFASQQNLTSLDLGSGVSIIGESAFFGMSSLLTLVIPNSVTTMGARAFSDANNLTSLTIGSGLTTISESAFASAWVLQELVIPQTVTVIGASAFEYLYRLNSLVIPNEVTTIGARAFFAASSLTSLTIPNSVVTVGINAFGSVVPNTLTLTLCKTLDLTDAGIPNDTPRVCGITAPQAPASVTATLIGITTASIAFEAPASNGGSPITRYTATASTGGLTKSISQSGSGTIDIEGLVSGTNYTFTVKARNAVGDSTASAPSNQITAPTAPGRPTNVSATVVSGTTVRVSFTAPASDGGQPITEYTAIASAGGFSNTITQSGSGSITLVGLDPNTDYTFTVIARNAVGESMLSDESTSITTPNVPSPPISVSAIRFGETVGDIEFITPEINSTETVTAYTAIATPGGLTWSITDPTLRYIQLTGLTAGVTYTFNVYATNAVGNSGLSPISNALIGTQYSKSTGNGDVECKTSGRFTGEGYFTVTNNIVTSSSNCQGLVEIPEGVTAIADSVFEDSYNIESVLIADTVITIERDAFRNIRALTNVSFGDGLQTIGSNAFRDSTSMTSITLSNSIVTIDSSAFRGLTSLTSLYIGDGVTSIDSSAFRGLTSLTSLYIGESVQSIGTNAFRDAVLLTSLEFPNSLTTIGDAAFSEANSLTSITFGTGLTSIGDYAFRVTTNLTSLTIPEGVTTIGGYAFWNTGLVSLRLPNSLLSVGAEAFLFADALETINYCGNRYENEDFVEWGVDTGEVGISCIPPVITPPVITPPVITPPPSSVFVAPTPIPYLRTLTTPKKNLKDGKLICTPGTYNAGFTLNGVTQGSSTTLFTPTNFTYNLIINGIAQISLVLTSSNPSHSWDMPSTTSGTLITCSVTVTANGVTNTDRSSDNAAGITAASVTQSNSLATANSDYSAALNANSKAYQKALIDNRAQWRQEITAIRANYYEVLARINSEGSSRKMISEKSTALKIMIAAQKKSATDYKASQPAAFAAKGAADIAALDAKTVAITKANATYGTFIESIGYGVLIP